jgi:SAM-dependent methyltransferase
MTVISSDQLNRGVGDRAYFENWYLSRDYRFYAPLVAQIIEHSKPGPLLDVGAGLGYLVECAQRWGLDARGVEGSRDAVEIGKARFAELAVQHHPLSEPLPFADGAFQTVIMNQVIEHLETEVAERAVREIFRVLRPEGLLMVLSPSKYNEHERKVDPTHINLYSPSELRQLLLRAGFASVVPFDAPLPRLGTSRAGQRVVGRLFRMTRWDWLSASANARAFKGSG